MPMGIGGSPATSKQREKATSRPTTSLWYADKREKHKERQRLTQNDRQTQRKTDRHKERQTDTKKDRQKDRVAVRKREAESNREIGIVREEEGVRQTHCQSQHGLQHDEKVITTAALAWRSVVLTDGHAFILQQQDRLLTSLSY